MRAVFASPLCLTPAALARSGVVGHRWSAMCGAAATARAVARGAAPGSARVRRRRRRRVACDADVGELRHGEARIAAGIDVGERREVHRDVDGEAVVRAAVAHLEPQRRDLRLAAVAPHVDARRRRLAVGGDAHANQAILPPRPRWPGPSSRTPRPRPPQVEQQVRDELAGTVVGDLPAAVDLEHRDAVVAQQVLASGRRGPACRSAGARSARSRPRVCGRRGRR